MSQPYWRLAIESEFSASHALRHYMGKCEHIHGHNFSVIMEVQGNTLTQDTEFLMDFSLLKKLLKKKLEQLDHKDLNTTPPFTSINPTSENLARYIYQEMCPLLPAQVQLYSVTVGEKPGQRATYFEQL